MKPFYVRISHGVTTEHIVVHARSQDEAIAEALHILKINYLDWREILVVPREENALV